MITQGKVVQLNYSLVDTEGRELDRADGEDPFFYLHGAGEIVPGLEKALEGMTVGDKKSVEVPPKEGYGEVIHGLRMKVEREQFPKEQGLEPGRSPSRL